MRFLRRVACRMYGVGGPMDSGGATRGSPSRRGRATWRGWVAGAGLLIAAGCAGVEMEAMLPTADDYPIHGIDVARYQGDIDWHAVNRDPGVHFAWIKATEGGDYLDPKFIQNWYAADAAGVARGAYHFWYFCRTGAEQLQWFIDNVPNDPGALPPVLDMEWNGHSQTCRKRPGKEEVLREMAVFIAGIERYYGKTPVIYTSVDFHEERLEGELDRYPFWVRSVAAHPKVRYPTRDWKFWQYTAKGRVDGIEGDVDRNAFSGSREEWRNWLIANTRSRSFVGAYQSATY